MIASVRTLSIACIAALLCACGQSPIDSPSAVPGIAPAAQTKTGATIRIKIPKPRRFAHGSKFISPSTKSLAMTFTPTPSGTPIHVNANLTPADPRCTGSPLVCTIALPVPPRSYLVDFITYDGILDSHGNPTGFILSKNLAVPLTFAKEKHNLVTVTLGGLPAYVAFIPLAGSTLVQTGSTSYTLSKCFATQPVGVAGEDIDNNIILGPGEPTTTLSSDDPTHLAIATPSPYSPNLFYLTRPSVPNAQSTVHLTARATALATAGGAAAVSTITVTFNSDICGVFTEYTTSGNPTGITSGPDGALWFTQNAGNAIARIPTSGSPITTSTIPTSSSGPVTITTGPDGALWFVEYGASQIGQITTDGHIAHEYTTTTAGSAPYGIVSDLADNRLWFAETVGDNLGRMTTMGAITEHTTGTISQPNVITVGPDAALWFTAPGSNVIASMSTNGSIINTYTVPTGGSAPYGIVTGPDQALWFTELSGNKIGRVTTAGSFIEYTIPTSGSTPQFITTGPDGALWFVEVSGNKIARITTAGSFTEFSVPTASAQPYDLVTGADNTLWFTERVGNKIGQLR